MGLANSTGFTQRQIEQALTRVSAGKFLNPLDMATEGSLVLELREKAKPEEYVTRVFEFPDINAVRRFNDWLAIYSGQSVCSEFTPAAQYNSRFEVPRS